MEHDEHRRLFLERQRKTEEERAKAEAAKEPEAITSGRDTPEPSSDVINLKKRKHRRHQREQRVAAKERRNEKRELNAFRETQSVADDEELLEVIDESFGDIKELQFDPEYQKTLKDLTDHPRRWSNDDLLDEFLNRSWESDRPYCAAFYTVLRQRGVIPDPKGK